MLVFLLPLPFAGNTAWAWPLFSGLSLLLLSQELAQRIHTSRLLEHACLVVTEPFRHARFQLIALAVVQLWVLIQLLSISQVFYDTFTAWFKGLGYCSFFALSLLILNTRERVEQLLWVVILAGAIQAFYGSLMVISGLEYGFFRAKEDYLGYATGTFINRNSFANYLVMVLSLGIGYLLAQSSDYYGGMRQRLRQFLATMLSRKVIARLLLAMMVIAVVMSRSRMGNTAFFASMMVTGGLALLLMRHKTTSTTILLTSLLIIDVAIVGTFFGIDEVAERLEKSSTDSEQRDEMAIDTYYMWQEQPLTGFGAGTLLSSISPHKKEMTSAYYIDHAHNDYLEFLVELGAPAWLLLAAVVLISLANAIIAMRTRNNDFYKGMGFGATMGIIALGIHATVDFNLQIPANAYMFMLLLAMANIARFAPHERESGSHQRHRPRD